VLIPMELGHLPYRRGHNYEEYVSEHTRKRMSNKHWRRNVEQVIEDLRQALLPDYVVLGGGNVLHLKRLPPQARRGGNIDAFTGGLRLWQRNVAAVADSRPYARRKP